MKRIENPTDTLTMIKEMILKTCGEVEEGRGVCAACAEQAEHLEFAARSLGLLFKATLSILEKAKGADPKIIEAQQQEWAAGSSELLRDIVETKKRFDKVQGKRDDSAPPTTLGDFS